MTKDITIIVAASGERKDLTIEAGTTAEDILRAAGLEGYALSKEGDSGTFFQPKENVYAETKDGAKLWASTKPDVGSGEGGGPPASPIC